MKLREDKNVVEEKKAIENGFTVSRNNSRPHLITFAAC